MELLAELAKIMNELEIPFETAVYTREPPDEYVILCPIVDTYDLHADNRPGVAIQEVQISIFTKGSYKQLKTKILAVLLDREIIITERRFNGYDEKTGYYHYSIDVANYYSLEV